MTTIVRALVLLSIPTFGYCLERDVIHTINPGCGPSLCNDSDVNHVNLVHCEAVGPRDSIHVVWSTVGAPSVLVARTENRVNLSVDWDNFLNGQVPPVKPDVSFSSNPSVAFGFVLRSLVEYDDKDDVADPDHYRRPNDTTSARKVFPLESRIWQPVVVQNDNTFVFQTSAEDADLGTALKLQVRVNGSLTRGEALPRLQLTPNNTHLDLFLDNKTSLSEHSRFYLVVDVVNADNPLKLTNVSSIDDEYTPGVFTMYRLGAVDDQNPDNGRYAAWKPVAYTTKERSLEMQTLVRAFDPVDADKTIDNIRSVVGGYFGNIQKFQGDFSQEIKIGIGQQGDKFYRPC